MGKIDSIETFRTVAKVVKTNNKNQKLMKSLKKHLKFQINYMRSIMLNKNLKTRTIDIGITIPKMDSSFMDDIMCSNISDSYSNDVWFEDNLKNDRKRI